MSACTAHLTCRIDWATVSAVELERRDNGHGEFYAVLVDGDILGTVADRSVECFDGHTLERWAAFGGGNHLGDADTQADATRLVLDNFNRTSFSWRLALHG
jgi:hypothetical protein